MQREIIRRFKNRSGDIRLKVTMDSTASKVIKVEHENGSSLVDHGMVSDLKLANEKDRNRIWISEIPNNMTMETLSDPECLWYFFGGQWWKICP